MAVPGGSTGVAAAAGATSRTHSSDGLITVCVSCSPARSQLLTCRGGGDVALGTARWPREPRVLCSESTLLMVALGRLAGAALKQKRP